MAVGVVVRGMTACLTAAAVVVTLPFSSPSLLMTSPSPFFFAPSSDFMAFCMSGPNLAVGIGPSYVLKDIVQ